MQFELASRRTWQFILAPLSYLAILLARSTPSIGRLPADPGYDYILGGSEQGLRALVLGDPYFHFVARLIALVVSWFPLAHQVLTLSILVHFVWTACAVIITAVVTRESQHKWLGYFSGLLLVTAPHASESALGNVGNLKWPMITALIVACCSPTSIQRHPTLISVLAVLTGLTNPLTILCSIPLGLEALRRRQFPRAQLMLTGMIVGTLAIQVAKVGISSATSGQSAKVTSPWGGMGLFWWSGLVGPIVISATCIIILLVRQRVSTTPFFALQLAFVAGTLAIVSYRMGGIADRYFIAPMTLALMATLLIQHQLFVKTPLLQRAGWAVTVVVLLVPTLKWFTSGPYLMTPPLWKSEIARAVTFCKQNRLSEIEISSSTLGGTTLKCLYILNE